MKLLIRNETENDYRAVEEITREAFWNLYSPGCVEHYLVHEMRAHSDFLPELDFVAEWDGKLVGNIMYTKAWLVAETGKAMDILTFGPISVLPEYQRKGIGSALIQHTRELAIQQGARAIVIFGDPHNYCKLGFKSSKDLGISDLNGEYPYGLLALELAAEALAGHAWKYRYSAVYEVDEQAAAEYDQGFEKKEKGVQYSQEIFSIAFRAYLR